MSVATGYESSHNSGCWRTGEKSGTKNTAVRWAGYWRTSFTTYSPTRCGTGPGVSKESYSVQDLLSDDFQFQAKESRMLQANRPKPAVAVESAGGIDVENARYNFG